MARKLKPKRGVPYFIEWIDASAAPNKWQSHEEIDEMFDEDYIVWTLGWFHKETENYYIFCSTVSKANDAKAAVWAIPKGMIVRLKEVSYG